MARWTDRLNAMVSRIGTNNDHVDASSKPVAARERADTKAPHLVAGATSEDLALDYLCTRGLTLLQRNFHSRLGEIDLVMLDNDDLVFVEVRFRRNSRFGSAAESISVSKQRKIKLTAEFYLQSNPGLSFRGCRFDVLAIDGGRRGDHNSVTIDWISDAF